MQGIARNDSLGSPADLAPRGSPSVAPPADAAKQDESHVEVMKKASKSFYFSSLLLPHDIRMDITDLYAFLRYCDDVVDETHHSHRQKKSFLTQLALHNSHLQQHRDNQLPFPTISSDDDHTHTPTFQISAQVLAAYDRLAKKHHFSQGILALFVEGMAWDVSNKLYETADDLVQYCIRVASIVGFYCCYIMDTTDEVTLRYACCLGIAMQLTNIARDVGEDMRRGRVYLPLSWLSTDLQLHIHTYNNIFDQNIRIGKDESTIEGLSSQDLTLAQRQSIEAAVKKLLALAACYYEVAEKGIEYLPFNCQLAVRTASRVYNEIGVEVTKKQYNSIDSRAHVTLARKVVLFFQALMVFILTAIMGLFFTKLQSSLKANKLSSPAQSKPRSEPHDLSSSTAVTKTVKIVLDPHT